MSKMLKNLRLKLLLLLLSLVFTSISTAKVNISGNIQIWFNTSKSSNNNKTKKYIGNMDDRSFEERAFVINNRGYSFLRDQYGNKFLVRVVFDSKGNVVQEDLYETERFTVNCLGIRGDDSFCFTINQNGVPAIWDRYESKYIYEGRFLNNIRINNPFKTKYNDYFSPLFEF